MQRDVPRATFEQSRHQSFWIGIDKNAKLHAQVSRLEAELIKLQTELRELRDNKRTAPILPMRAAQRHASKPSARSPAI